MEPGPVAAGAVPSLKQALGDEAVTVSSAAQQASACGAEEAIIFAVWLDATMSEASEADRANLVRGCPDFYASDGGRALVAWLHRYAGLASRAGRN